MTLTVPASCDRESLRRRDLPYVYLNQCVATGVMPVFDDWLPEAKAERMLGAIRDAALSNGRDCDDNADRPNLDARYWTARAVEYRVLADKAEKLRLRLAGVTS